ncbi:MAG: branched-chain amino acid ABC transporter permease [Candidatus Velthaea sp.]
MKTGRYAWPLVGLILVIFITVPPFANGYVRSLFYVTAMYVGLTYGWNMISGYAGYLSFGQMTFFGLGAYTVAIGVTHWHVPWYVCALAGGALSALLALPLGFIMLRLRGPFFALGMLGVAQSLRILVETSGFTGGSSGVYLPPGANALIVYYWTVAVMIGAIAVTWGIDRSAFGLRLRALREDERAARTLGVDVTRTKVAAFVLSSIVPGLLGAAYAWYLTFVDPASVFSTRIELQTVAMAILGGIGTLWGPLVGGILMSQVSESLSATFPQGHLMIFGALIVVLLIAQPRGIMPAVVAALRRVRS